MKNHKKNTVIIMKSKTFIPSDILELKNFKQQGDNCILKLISKCGHVETIYTTMSGIVSKFDSGEKLRNALVYTNKEILYKYSENFISKCTFLQPQEDYN